MLILNPLTGETVALDPTPPYPECQCMVAIEARCEAQWIEIRAERERVYTARLAEILNRQPPPPAPKGTPAQRVARMIHRTITAGWPTIIDCLRQSEPADLAKALLEIEDAEEAQRRADEDAEPPTAESIGEWIMRARQAALSSPPTAG